MAVPRGAVTREEFAALVAEIEAVRASAVGAASAAEESKRLSRETHDMVQTIHTALIHPQPGQTNSLLDRMASVTIDIESGKRTGKIVMALIGFALAVGAFLKWGQFPNVKG